MTALVTEAGLLAALSACAATWAVGWAARRRGLLAQPAIGRMHTTPTPRLGGIGLALGIALGWFYAHANAEITTLDNLASEIFGPFLGPDRPLIAGALAFFVVGLLDDLRGSRGGLRPWLKLALQAAAATLPICLGLRFNGQVDLPASPWPSLSLGSMSPLMTGLWLLAVVNVVNFMDGIDGIVAATAVVMFAAAAGEGSATEPYFIIRHHLPFIAAGATIGFAVWNAPPASIFMGDGGSHLLGFLLASGCCLTPNRPFAQWVSAPWVSWPLVAAPLLPAIVDVAEALIHKARHGIPMSQAHDDHLYQRLVKAGWSHGAVAIRYGVLALVAVVLVGPVAARIGALPATAVGLAILGLHLWTGARTTCNVPRLAKS